jgi:thioredoxin-dependent peroxiredoxin
VRPVVILFAKAPLPGRAKTRLVPPLSPALAASVHTAFVWDTIERLQTLDGIVDIELHTDTCTDAWEAAGVSRVHQSEGDLGLKMLQALRSALQAGRDRAMIVGTDAPTLPVEHLESLLCAHADVALGPTDDGGYYAIACRNISDRMFDGVPWSAPDTLQRTAAAALACGLTVEYGPSWWDVDTPEDLARLLAEHDLPRNTAQVLSIINRGETNQMLKEGEPAPDIHVADDKGEDFHLSKLKGKNVVLYFYPKADTPGCTTESCEFRDASTKFGKQDTVIVGVSPDKSAAQSKFRAKFDLPFTLLADVNHSAAETYGVWKEKSMYGKKYMGIERTTFLIGKDGKIRKIFAKVKPEGHAEEVYEALQKL